MTIALAEILFSFCIADAKKRPKTASATIGRNGRFFPGAAEANKEAALSSQKKKRKDDVSVPTPYQTFTHGGRPAARPHPNRKKKVSQERNFSFALSHPPRIAFLEGNDRDKHGALVRGATPARPTGRGQNRKENTVHDRYIPGMGPSPLFQTRFFV
jgi:hypothetical protein